MNASKNSLNRLLRAAAKATPREVPAELPFALQQRVLARWRAGASRDDEEVEISTAILALFRRGLAFACLVMVVCLALGVLQNRQTSETVWTDPSTLVSLTDLQ